MPVLEGAAAVLAKTVSDTVGQLLGERGIQPPDLLEGEFRFIVGDAVEAAITAAARLEEVAGRIEERRKTTGAL